MRTFYVYKDNTVELFEGINLPLQCAKESISFIVEVNGDNKVLNMYNPNDI